MATLIASNDDLHCVCRPFDLFASLTQMPGWAQVRGGGDIHHNANITLLLNNPKFVMDRTRRSGGLFSSGAIKSCSAGNSNETLKQTNN